MSERRAFTPEFKAQVVLEELTGVKDKAGICREYRLRPQVFSRWREEFLERASEIFDIVPCSAQFTNCFQMASKESTRIRVLFR